MDAFLEALTAGENKIPPEFDWFAPLLGDWDFTYTDGLGGGRTVQEDGGWRVNSDVYARRRGNP